VVHPATEEELADIVAVARHAKVAVRAVGAMHSQAPVPHTDGVRIVLDHTTRRGSTALP
jgi:FAD/FMN-containing dehydrogenase